MRKFLKMRYVIYLLLAASVLCNGYLLYKMASSVKYTFSRFGFVYGDGSIIVGKGADTISLQGVVKVVDIDWLEKQLGIGNETPFK